jgi:hypothetical protein
MICIRLYNQCYYSRSRRESHLFGKHIIVLLFVYLFYFLLFCNQEKSLHKIVAMEPLIVPDMKRGWLTKQGRNLFKSWKKRYFVLENGLMSYYESDLDLPPYGSKLKGQMSMRGARLDVYYDTGGIRDEKRLYVAGGGAENDVLLEGTNSFEIRQWSVALEQHISFANERPEFVLFREDDERSSKNELIRENLDLAACSPGEGLSPGFSSPTSLTRAWDAENIVNKMSFEPISFTPTPGFVVKTRTGDGSKIFVNVCGDANVPMSDKKRGNKMWPLMIFGEERQSIDKTGDHCNLVDVVVNPQLIDVCNPDTEEGEAVREAVILKILESLQKKDPGISDDYSIPKITKKYKGDTVPECTITVAHLTPYGRKFVNAKAKDEERAAEPLADQPGETSGDRKAMLRKKMMSVGKKDVGFGNVVKAVIPPQAKPAPLVPQRPQRQIPYIVTRPGAVVYERAEKGSRRVSKLTNNSRLYVNTKKADRTKKDLYWFKTPEGWIPGTTDGGQRIIEPCFETSSPVNINIVNTSFADPPQPGFWESVFFFIGKRLTFQVVFTIEIAFARGAVLKIRRNMSSICTIRTTILNNGGGPAQKMLDLEKRKNIELPCLMNGDEILLEGGMELIEFVEQVGAWLAAMGVGSTTDYPPLTDLLCPCEEDADLIENELMAVGGFEGAWGLD